MRPPIRLSVRLESVNCSDRFQPRLCLRVLRADLREDPAQLVEVHRFGKMEIEACFFASPNVVVLVESSKGHAFDWLPSLGLGNDVVAAPVWQANVTQDYIELLRLDNLQGALRAIGH